MSDRSGGNWSATKEANLFVSLDGMNTGHSNHEGIANALHQEYCRLTEPQREQTIAALNDHFIGSEQWTELKNGDDKLVGIRSNERGNVFYSTICDK